MSRASLALLLACHALGASLVVAQPAAGDEGLGASPATRVRIEAAAGAGAGTRRFRRPTDSGLQRLPTAPFAAADLALRAHVAPEAAWSLEVALRYQTSLGLTVEERPLFALPNQVAVRAERLELSAGPIHRLGPSPESIALALPIGLSLRAFWPDVRELTTPAYSLFGPHLRAELIATLAPGLRLRAGPELHLILAIDDSVAARHTERVGIAVGGEASLRLDLASAFALELSYRQSHAFVAPRADGPSFQDVERFATARVVVIP